MNDELITRLRAAHDDCPVPAEPSLYSAAADALEAAQAELTQARGIIEHWQRRFDTKETEATASWKAMQVARYDLLDARAERDAEAALADQLAEALRWMYRDPYGPTSHDLTNTALAAHRERRTTPTKENTDG